MTQTPLGVSVLAMVCLVGACGSTTDPGNRNNNQAPSGSYQMTDSVVGAVGGNRTWHAALGGVFTFSDERHFAWDSPVAPARRAGTVQVFEIDGANRTLFLTDTVNNHGWFAIMGPQTATVDQLGKEVDLLVRFADGSSDYAFEQVP